LSCANRPVKLRVKRIPACSLPFEPAISFMPPSATAPTTSAKRLTLATNASFVPIGMVTVLLSPLLPTLSSRWSLDYSQAGALFTAQFLASTVAVALSGILIARFGFRCAINAGLLVTAVSTSALLAGPRILGIACIAGYGAGSGLAVPAANLLVAELNPTRRSSALNVLNFAWSAGAVSCPFLVAAAEKSHHLLLLLQCVAGLCVLVAFWIAAMRRDRTEPQVVENSNIKKISVNWRQRSVPVLLALFFLYVGTENAFGGWLASYSISLKNMPVAIAVISPSFFYGSITLGRLLAPALLRRWREVRVVQLGLLVGCAGMAGLIRSHHFLDIAISAGAAGFGLSSVYPITISFLSREFGSAAARVASLAFMMSNLGGACLPWLVGVFSTQLGTIRSGLAIPLLGGATMYLLYLPDWRSAEPQSS
jgi:MFS transporter, FHS family, glucose/mannose:H+ symporter